MAGGLPGVGLAGAFFIVAGLIMPFVEFVRMLRGRSSGTEWRLILRNFLVALGIVTALAITYLVVAAASDVVTPTGNEPRRSSIGAISLWATAVIMSLVLGVPLLQHVLRKRVFRASSE